jgi:hypothetical protein
MTRTAYEVQVHDNRCGMVTMYRRVTRDHERAVHEVIERPTVADRTMFLAAGAELTARVREWGSEDPNAWRHFRVLPYTVPRAHVEAIDTGKPKLAEEDGAG